MDRSGLSYLLSLLWIDRTSLPFISLPRDQLETWVSPDTAGVEHASAVLCVE